MSDLPEDERELNAQRLAAPEVVPDDGTLEAEPDDDRFPWGRGRGGFSYDYSSRAYRAWLQEYPE